MAARADGTRAEIIEMLASRPRTAGEPFVTNGVVRAWQIRAWNEVLVT